MVFAEQQQSRLVLLDVDAGNAADRLPRQLCRRERRLNRRFDVLRTCALAAPDAEIGDTRPEMQRMRKRLCLRVKTDVKPFSASLFKSICAGSSPSTGKSERTPTVSPRSSAPDTYLI